MSNCNILTQLPVKSLNRINCVSPSWKFLISDPQFARTHLNRTENKNSKYPERKIIISSRCGNHNNINPTPPKLEFPTVEQQDAKKWVQVLCSCDGMLEVSLSDKSIFLLNPSTRECKKLPICPFVQINTDLHPDGLYVYGVGYDSSTDDYKLLLMLPYIYEDRCDIGTLKVAAYSLKTNAWRRLEDFQYGFLFCFFDNLYGSLVRNSSGVFLHGCLHYLCWDGNGSKRIIAFDLSDEVFKQVPLPSCLEDSINDRFCRLEVRGDCLCLVRQHSGLVGLWMREEHGVRESWIENKLDMPGMSL